MEEVESKDYQLTMMIFGTKEHFVMNENYLTFAVDGFEQLPFDYNFLFLPVAYIDLVDNYTDLVKSPSTGCHSFLTQDIETCWTFVVVGGYILVAGG